MQFFISPKELERYGIISPPTKTHKNMPIYSFFSDDGHRSSIIDHRLSIIDHRSRIATATTILVKRMIPPLEPSFTTMVLPRTAPPRNNRRLFPNIIIHISMGSRIFLSRIPGLGKAKDDAIPLGSKKNLSIAPWHKNATSKACCNHPNHHRKSLVLLRQRW